jgi:hypothetical protein
MHAWSTLLLKAKPCKSASARRAARTEAHEDTENGDAKDGDDGCVLGQGKRLTPEEARTAAPREIRADDWLSQASAMPCAPR